MIELSELSDDRLTRTYGGDTFNTAVYLARLGVKVDYVTALGDDPFSDDMLTGWRREEVGTAHVLRLPGRLPGLYLIRRDARGERTFITGVTGRRHGSCLPYRRHRRLSRR